MPWCDEFEELAKAGDLAGAEKCYYQRAAGCTMSGMDEHQDDHVGTSDQNGTAGPPSSTTVTNDGRGPGGRFSPGNCLGRQFSVGNRAGRGGAANPAYRRAAAARQAFAEAISFDELRELARKLYAQAVAGDATAAKVLLAYTIGKPAAAADPDSCDLNEWKLTDASPTKAAILRALLDSLPAGEAAAYVQEALAARLEADGFGRRLFKDSQHESPHVAGLQDKRSGRKITRHRGPLGPGL